MVMVGKDGEELDLAKLGNLSYERNLHYREMIRVDMSSKLDEIVRKNKAQEEDVEEARGRPYGVDNVGVARDIWGLILEKVTDPFEIRKLRGVSEMFRSILRRRFMEMRLPKMVKLILTKRPKYLLGEKAEADQGLDEWKWERKSRISTLVSMRLVSRQCKVAIDHIFRFMERNLTCLELTTTVQIHRIYESFVANPSMIASFFPVNVHIDEGWERGNLQQFQQAITEFLGLVGHRIIFFEYYFEVRTPEEVYDCLRRWAELMPNLEHLSFDRLGFEEVEPAPVLEGIQPFPSLPLLRSYREGEGTVLPSPYVYRILEACPGIKDLRLTELEPVREHSLPLLEGLQNLTSLRICPYDTLLHRHNLPWKLKKLVLYKLDPTWSGGEWIPKAEVPSETVFMLLKQFEDTLEHLEFEMVMVTDPNDGFLELRNLKTLKIELHLAFENLNFLLYAEKLETLCVMVGDGNGFTEDLPSPNEKLDGIVRNSFLGMSVQDVFPSMKRFRIYTEDFAIMRDVVSKW